MKTFLTLRLARFMESGLLALAAGVFLAPGVGHATPSIDFGVPPPPGWLLNLNGKSWPINPDRYVQYTAYFLAAQTTTHITFALTDSTFDEFFLDNILVANVDNPSINLVRNGGFEGGTAPSGGNPGAPVDWQYLNPYGVYYRSSLWCGGVGQGGSSCAWTPGFDQAYDFITQPIATVIGDEYQINFWAQGPDEGDRWNELNGNGDWPEFEGDSFNIIVYAGSVPAVPEPEALGTFAFGVLLIGGFLALRHREYRQA